jgi:DNA-binding NtrC family response regulator
MTHASVLVPDIARARRIDELTRLNLVGDSPVFREAVQLIQRIAVCDATTLIEGETGTGKEVAARAIHYLGARRDFAFIPVNCGALTDTLLESELFGHEKGAFTDAKERRSGLVAEADGGTLFLDEVEAMSPRAQVVLLRFLQDQKYRPIGGRAISSANVRILAASNAELSELSDRNLFRRDLLFRLSVLQVYLPPLRERAGDAVLLARMFLDRFSMIYNRPPKRLHPDSLRWLELYDWPGNVRELENIILREFLLTDAEEMLLPSLLSRSFARRAPECARTTNQFDQPFKQAKKQAVAQFESSYIRQLLAKTAGNVSLAAKLANKDRSALNRLVKKHGVNAEEFRTGRSLPDSDDVPKAAGE